MALKVASVLDAKFIRSIQIPMDKATGKRKGFAFIDCTTVENAQLLKDALNGSSLRDDRLKCALSVDFSTSSRSSKAAAASSAAQVAILQATAASAMTAKEHKPVVEYVYDQATGYYRHTSTGVLYDPNTGLFFNSGTNAWYSWNEKTQEYSIVGGAPVVASASERAPQETAALEPKRQVVAVVTASPTASSVAINLRTKYRDRAKERRQLHGHSVLEELEPTMVTTVRGRITGGKIRASRGNVFQ